MLFLRSLVHFIGSYIVLIIVVSLILVLFFLPLRIRYKITSKWAIFNIWWLKITCNIKTQVIGVENIPQNPCIIVSNHQSIWETLSFQTIFPHQTWVLKRELLWIPVFGWGLALLEPIIIDRSEKLKALKKVIKQGVNRLHKGIFLVIYPEGTRQPHGKLGTYQKGAAAIAIAAKSELLPVYHNAGKTWGKGRFIKYPGVVVCIIGEPISNHNKSATELTKQVRKWAKKQADIYG